MQLKRSQRDGGIVSKTVIFCLDARTDLTHEEQANVNRYKLGSQVIYNSEASKRHLGRANEQNDGTATGGLKSLASLALAAMKLNITINGLQNGQHIECKTLDELLGAEEAIMAACQTLKDYLDTAATFDGRETLIDFSTGAPAVVAPSTPTSLLVEPPLGVRSVAPTAQLSPPLPIEAPAYASASVALQPDSGLSGESAAVDEYGLRSGEGFDFGAPLERVASWWTHATMGQRIMASGGGLLGLYVLYHVL